MKEEETPQSENEKPNKRRAKKSLADKLSDAVKDLYYISETDAPFEPFVWHAETGAEGFSSVNAADVLHFAEKLPETPIQEQTLADFFRFPATEQDWHTDEDKKTVRRFQKLQKLLETNLKDPKVFKLGEVELDVYIVGVDADGNLAGVKTQAVET
jgi:hypothetical protein